MNINLLALELFKVRNEQPLSFKRDILVTTEQKFKSKTKDWDFRKNVQITLFFISNALF